MGVASEARADDFATVALELRDVTVRFGGVVALDNISVNLQMDRITALIGPNGAGKTTLLDVASGFLKPSSGEIRMNGRDISRARAWKRARLGLARTFQRVSLFEELTVRQHLLLGSLLHKDGGGPDLARAALNRGRSLERRLDPEARSELEWLVDALELGGVIDSGVQGLPLGTARLVNLARALLSRPTVLLMDEPASGLGSHESAQLARAIRRVGGKRSVAMMVIEHHLDFVTDLCDHIVVLDFGEIIADGPPSTVLSDERVRNAYMGGYEAVAREQARE